MRKSRVITKGQGWYILALLAAIAANTSHNGVSEFLFSLMAVFGFLAGMTME